MLLFLHGKKEVDLIVYDEAQVEAARLLNKRYQEGHVPGLDGLVNELSRITTPDQAGEVIDKWDKGKGVRLPNPYIRRPDDGF